MSFKSRMSHVAELAKWKTNQQFRLMKSQNEINEYISSINACKNEIAALVLEVFRTGGTVPAEVVSVCERVPETEKLIGQLKHVQDDMRNEAPPELAEAASDSGIDQEESLVCPECRKQIAGQFCPDHGLQGIFPDAISEAIVDTSSPDQKKCPVCGQLLNVRFCPQHGVEGI